MPNASKQKGSRGELELLELFREAGIPARKVPLSGAAPDFKGDLLVEISPNDEEIIEVKRRRHGFTRIYQWLLDAYALAFRDDRQEWIITMRLDDLLELLRPQSTRTVSPRDKTTADPLSRA